MKRWQVSGRTIFFLGMLLWLLGLATGWLAIPFGPHDGWQLSRDEVLCGILKDGPTMVTVPRPPSLPRTVGTPETGPIRLWNIETGELRAEHFTQTDVFDRVLPEESLGLIKVQEKVPDKPHTFRLRLLEALSGKQLAEFTATFHETMCGGWSHRTGRQRRSRHSKVRRDASSGGTSARTS